MVRQSTGLRSLPLCNSDETLINISSDQSALQGQFSYIRNSSQHRASRDCLKRVTTQGPRSRPHTTAGLYIWIGIAIQVCRNCELFLTEECLAGEALSICAPKREWPLQHADS